MKALKSEHHDVELPSTLDVKKLGELFVLGEDRSRLRLRDFWSSGPAILVFLRHFACLACRAHVQDIWANREKYEKAGAQIYFIGNGAPHAVRSFKDELGIQEAWIFTDPTLESFHAAGFRRGLGTPPAFRNRHLEKLRTRGFTGTKWTPEQGDQWQLGGVLAIKPGGVVTYHYVSESIGDFPMQSEPEGEIKVL